MRLLVSAMLLGCLLGITLSLIGFSDYDAVYRMFALEEWRLIFTFAFSVVILGSWFFLTKRSATRSYHVGIIPGGILFGIGWAISGACPSIPLVQLGEGKWWAGATMAGVAVGIVCYRYVHPRWFKWTRGSCSS